MRSAETMQNRVWRAYQEHRRGLFALAYAITGTRDVAEDAVHDGVVAVVRGTGTPRNPKAYLYRAVRNEALRAARASAARGGIAIDAVGESLIAPSADRPDRRALAGEEAAALRDALLAIRADEREVIVLRIHAGLKFREIADLLGVPLPTAASRYQRGITHMAKELKEIADVAE